MGTFPPDPPPKAKGQPLLLHPDANRHTSIPHPSKLRSPSSSEPGYEVRDPQSGRRYAPIPPPSHYGPHFEKGPLQDEIWDIQLNKGIWHSLKKIDKTPFREECRHRAHSFHEARQEHTYSDPYKVRPEPWTKLMEAEWEEYHRLSDTMSDPSEYQREAKRISLGEKHTPTPAQGAKIKNAISVVRACQTMTIEAAQARTGFMQKYPQAYKATKIAGHIRQVAQQKRRHKEFRKAERHLNYKYKTWERQMSLHSGSTAGL